MIPTDDEGYIVAGASNFDVFVVKTNSHGDSIWTRKYGGSNSEGSHCIREAVDGGYIIAATTDSYGAGETDCYLIRIDEAGDTLWTRTYGGAERDRAFSVCTTSDGGFLFAGDTYSYGAGNRDVYLIRTDSMGDTLWTRTYGGSGGELAWDLQKTADNCYIVYGVTGSYGAGEYDLWLLKIDSNGDTIWTATYGGYGTEYPGSIEKTSDGGYILVGTTCSTGGEGCHAYVLKLECSDLPYPLSISFGANQTADHLTIHEPTLQWEYFDPCGQPQDRFEIAVGIDNDWEYSEMWNPPPFATEDTSVVYGGAPLLDGEAYWLRLRVHNSISWSEWTELSFRMNSIPTSPILESPVADESVNTLHPGLTVTNSSDAEGDSLYYTFEISPDSFTAIVYTFTQKEETGSTTTLVVDSTLTENERYWWRAKSSDYYEESDFSYAATFFVNSENTAPSAFSLILPPDTSGAPVATLTPEFFWSKSFDPDPFDSVTYELWIAIDSNFTFVHQVPDIHDVSYVLIDSLDWGTDYWWKVRADDQNGASIWSDNVQMFRTVTLGDADASGEVDIDDVVYLLNYIFSGGLPPLPEFAGDADCSSEVDIDDVVYLIQYIFASGTAPCDPNGDEVPDC
ncbi:MAG: dockerin type I repeat-containing protein [Candidatus Zixiibacteriota bacterium]